MKTIIKLIKENPDAIYGKGANEVDIVEAEEKLELKFADEYREYLSAFAIAAIDGNEFTGLSKSSRTNVVPVTQNQRRLLHGIPDDQGKGEAIPFHGPVFLPDPPGQRILSFSFL